MDKNRFNVLNIDDEDEEIRTVPTQTPAVLVEKPVVVAERREWSVDKDKPKEVREWNIEKTKFTQHRKKGPFQRKFPFKDDHHTNKHFRNYSFKDESPVNETIKPPSPIHKDIEFPKLVNSSSSDEKPVKSSTEIHTFAEKIKAAMEKQIEQKEKPEEPKNTIHMFSVIPMKTKLGDSLQFLS